VDVGHEKQKYLFPFTTYYVEVDEPFYISDRASHLVPSTDVMRKVIERCLAIELVSPIPDRVSVAAEDFI